MSSTTVSGSLSGESVSKSLQVRNVPKSVVFSITGPFAGRVRFEYAPPGADAHIHFPGPKFSYRNSLLSVAGVIAMPANSKLRLHLYNIEIAVQNGGFDADSLWTKGAGWTIAGGVAVATGAISTAIYQTMNVNLVPGASYDVTYTLTRSAGSLQATLGGGTGGSARSTAATFTDTLVAGSSDQTLTFTGTGFTGTIDNVTIQPHIVYSFSDNEALLNEWKDPDGNSALRLWTYGVEIIGSLINAAGKAIVNGLSLIQGGRLSSFIGPAVVTNTTTETVAATATIPANTLQPGQIIKVRFQGIATATQSTDTLGVKLYINGTAGTNLITIAATDVANNDVFQGEYEVAVRDIGGTGHVVGVGTYKSIPAAEGTMTIKDDILGSTVVDTTAAITIDLTLKWSVQSASDSAQVDFFRVEIV